MIILLKIILGIFSFLVLLVERYIYKDWNSSRKTPEYDENTLMSKFVINGIFAIITVCAIVFVVLMVIYIILPMQIAV